MKIDIRNLALAACLCVSYPTLAQDAYPTRPITIVVPYPAGGTSDGQVRMIQEPLSKLLGQPVIVDNKPGASGVIGAQLVSKAKGDGYTLLYPNNGVLSAAILNKNAAYDPLKDFKAVSLVSSVPLVLVTSQSTPVKNLTEFVQYAKRQPNGLLYASAGSASYGHIMTARLAQQIGIKVDHVPYKGEANTTMAVRTGDVQMLLTTPSSAMLGQVTAGTIRLLGVASEKPSPIVPNAETINKVAPGFTAAVWFGLLAPAATPRPVIEKINAAIAKVVADPAVRAKLLASGAVPTASTPSEMTALMSREHTQLQEIISKNKIEAE